MPGKHVREFFESDWSKLHIYAGLLCVASVAVPLSIEVALTHGHPGIGTMIAAGAFSAGFGSFQHLRESRLIPMVLASFGMCVASWAGTLAGLSPLMAVVLSGIAAGLYAVISQHSQAASWVALQCVIWFIISTAYPEHGLHALTRGLLILAGGLLQTTSIGLWAHYERVRHKYKEGEVATIFSAPPEDSSSALRDEYPRMFAFRSAVTLAVAAVLYKAIPAQNAYWIPMTAAIMIRPEFRDTAQRGLMRLIGTMAGSLLATVVVLAFPASPWTLTIGTILFAWASYALFQVNYTYFAACLTAYVVFLLTLAGYMEEPLVVRRIAFTAIGGLLALVLHWLARHAIRTFPSPVRE